MSGSCQWLQEQLAQLPLMRFPFSVDTLPRNGIYVFYESGETWGHGDDRPRVVRIGTHRRHNFRTRIAEHYLLNERKMNFDVTRPAPKDRSIFRKNLGRAMLNAANDAYLPVWDIDFTTSQARRTSGSLRDIPKEQELERAITQRLRTQFAFRVIRVDAESDRLGTEGLEAALIGTIAQCACCHPSPRWLGHHSPVNKVRASGLWLSQHLQAPPLVPHQQLLLSRAIATTMVERAAMG